MGTFFGISGLVLVLILCVFLYHKTWSPFFCEKCGSVFTFTYEKRVKDANSKEVVRIYEVSKCWFKKCRHKQIISTREELKKEECYLDW